MVFRDRTLAEQIFRRPRPCVSKQAVRPIVALMSETISLGTAMRQLRTPVGNCANERLEASVHRTARHGNSPSSHGRRETDATRFLNQQLFAFGETACLVSGAFNACL